MNLLKNHNIKYSADIIISALLLAFVFAGASQANDSGPSIEELKAGFARPDATRYGPVPLWWWDADRLDKERMTWQLDRLNDQGVKTVCVIYWRPNDAKPVYFTDAWWDYWEFAVEQCKKRGMSIWYYDQYGFGNYGWQSKLVGDDLSRQSRTLQYTDKEVQGGVAVEMMVPAGPDFVSATALPSRDGQVDGAGAIDVSGSVRDGVLRWTAPEGKWLLAIVGSKLAKALRDTKANDPMNRAVTEDLLDQLYEAYDHHNPGEFGKTIVGCFADELGLWQIPPWSPVVAEAFQLRKGYDVRPLLAALWTDIGPVTPKVRIDFYDVVCGLAEENFFKPIYDWHEARNLLLSYDHWGRKSLLAQTRLYGDYYRLLRWYSAPGYDDAKCEGPRRNFFDAKISSSIANCYNRPRVWCEAFHSTGWGLTPATQTAWMNENYVYGASLYNKHGLYYSTRGGWYEWASPSAHWRQPYWRHYGRFAEYITRLSYLLSQGVHRCDVAILWPITTVQAHMAGGGQFDDIAKTAEADNAGIGWRLFERGIDFNWMDDHTFHRARIGAETLCVSGTDYEAVVLPSVAAIRMATLEKIRDFYQRGGCVIAYGCLPDASDTGGRGDPKLAAMLREIFGLTAAEAASRTQATDNSNAARGRAVFIPEGYDTVEVILNDSVERDAIAPHGGLFVMHRRVVERDLFFVFNSADHPVDAEVLLRAQGDPYLWDAWSGKSRPVRLFTREGDVTRIRLSLEAGGAAPILFEPTNVLPAISADEMREIIDVKQQGERAKLPPTIELDGPWDFEVVPTVDNRWGDFDYPPSTELIGPNARMFRYTAVSEAPSGWQSPNYDDSRWRSYRYSYGPFFWRLTAREDTDQGALEKKLLELERLDPRQPLITGGQRHLWEEQRYSPRFGIVRKSYFPSFSGALGQAKREFLELTVPKGRPVYLWTAVVVPEVMTARFQAGQGFKGAWLNGELLANHQRVQLAPGPNRFLVKFERADKREGPWRTYAVLRDTETIVDQFGAAAKWIWAPGETPNNQKRYFRTTLRFRQIASNATLNITCDNVYTLYVNDVRIGTDSKWEDVERYDVTHAIRRGDNVIAVEGHKTAGRCGVIAELVVSTDYGVTLQFGTDNTWRASNQASEGWTTTGFDDSGWAEARTLGPADMKPWGEKLQSTELFADPTADRDPREMPWFQTEYPLYDAYAGHPPRFGLYRFDSAPGARAMRLTVRGEVTEAFINGQAAKLAVLERRPDGDRVYEARLPKPCQSRGVAALRIAHEPGAYAGAALPEPVAFECEPGRIELGDWTQQGLYTYSGTAWYRRNVRLPEVLKEQRWFLELGEVKATAEVHINGRETGVLVAPPWRLDVTDHLQPGQNRIEILVANTLANFHSIAMPSPFAHGGEGDESPRPDGPEYYRRQLVSGLIGPVSLQPMGEPANEGAGPHQRPHVHRFDRGDR